MSNIQDLQFEKLRSNKALVMNAGAPDSDGHFAELFTVILEQDNTLTFQFSKSVLIEPQAGNAFNIRAR